MSLIGYISRRFKVELVLEKKFFKSQLISKYKNNNIENKTNSDIKDIKVNEFMLDSDVKVCVLIHQKGTEVYNYLKTVGNRGEWLVVSYKTEYQLFLKLKVYLFSLIYLIIFIIFYYYDIKILNLSG